MGTIPSRLTRQCAIASNASAREAQDQERPREDTMTSLTRRSLALLPVLAPFLPSGIARAAAELNPAAVAYKLPDQIPWSPPSANGAQNAVLVGDPSKEGLYINMTKWLA